jgi:hypothetical protein
MRGKSKVAESLAALAILTGCPDTTSKVGGTSAGEDEVGDTDASEDVVDDHRTYFIGESTKYDGGGDCENADLNVVTNTLRNRLAEAGWSGHRLVDDNAWPEDFREGTDSVFALDGLRADAARLAIFAGHGGIGLLQWGRPSPNDECLADLDDNVRLGTLAGDTAAATMFMTSCTMRVDQAWPTLQASACRQFFGYHDSPHIGYDEARKVFVRTQAGQATVDAWLEEMVDNVIGHNSPVVLTMGTGPADATNVHGATNLATGEGYLESVGEPADNYFFEWFNNGCNSVCGNCSTSAAVPPTLTLGSIAPRLKLSRPQRSSAELVELALTLLARFDIATLDADEQRRLDAWASTVTTTRDITHAQILDEPRIDLTYDPQLDRLRITDRSALARARPCPGEILDDDADLPAMLHAEAEAVRGRLQAIAGALDRLGTSFEQSTREVGYGGTTGPQSPSIAYEYVFSLPGQIEDLALPGRSLEIGVTRLGELSTLSVASVNVEVIGDARFVRTPEQAIDQLITAIHDEHPNVVEVEIVEPVIGYVLAEDQASAEVEPRLLVSYVLVFGSGESRVVSRSFPVAISLIDPDGSMASIESLEAKDPNPQAGDARDSSY